MEHIDPAVVVKEKSGIVEFLVKRRDLVGPLGLVRDGHVKSFGRGVVTDIELPPVMPDTGCPGAAAVGDRALPH